MSPALDYFTNANTATQTQNERARHVNVAEPLAYPLDNGTYYNPRLNPANYLEGPLSSNPATRLRQMLARPGIVVCFEKRASSFIY